MPKTVVSEWVTNLSSGTRFEIVTLWSYIEMGAELDFLCWRLTALSRAYLLEFSEGVKIFTLTCLSGQKCALTMLPIYIVFPILVIIRASKTTVISWVCLKPARVSLRPASETLLLHRALFSPDRQRGRGSHAPGRWGCKEFLPTTKKRRRQIDCFIRNMICSVFHLERGLLHADEYGYRITRVLKCPWASMFLQLSFSSSYYPSHWPVKCGRVLWIFPLFWKLFFSSCKILP